MKRFNWRLIGSMVLCLAMIPLTGCEQIIQSAGGVVKSEFDALQAEHEALQTEHATLVDENTSLKGEIETAEADLADLRAEYDSLKAEYEALQSFREELVTELNEIKRVYPPRYFNDRYELEDWVAEAVPEVGKYIDIWRQHLELQKMALADGYIWSVSLDRDAKFISVVIAGDSVYWVWNDGYTEWVGSK